VVIGLTGYAGAGKTFVGEILASQGAEVINADQLGHAALEDRAVRQQLRDYFGAGIFAPDGKTVDRRRLGAEVFSNPEKLRFLESVSHPWIAKVITEKCADHAARRIVVDAALLKVLNLDALFAKIILVTAPFAVRLARVRNRGWDEAELRRRDAALAEKTYAATAEKVVVVDNSAGREELLRQLDKLAIFTL